MGMRLASLAKSLLPHSVGYHLANLDKKEQEGLFMVHFSFCNLLHIFCIQVAPF